MTPVPRRMIFEGALSRNSPQAALNYQVVEQSAEDVQNIDNAPAVSIGPYLPGPGRRASWRQSAFTVSGKRVASRCDCFI